MTDASLFTFENNEEWNGSESPYCGKKTESNLPSQTALVNI